MLPDTIFDNDPEYPVYLLERLNEAYQASPPATDICGDNEYDENDFLEDELRFYAVIHERRWACNRKAFLVDSIFEAREDANQAAMELFKKEYRVCFDEETKWFEYGTEDYMEDRTVQWLVLRGLLSLVVHDPCEGDECDIYVEELIID